MSGSSLSAPGSINDARTQAHLAIGQRLGQIDLTPLLVYTLVNPASGVLPLLQWQFDLSSPLWALLGGEESQASLVRQAIPLHRYQGTVYAIQTIVNALGFPVTAILEGQNSWGGNSWPADQGWAVFRVQILKASGTAASHPSSWDDLTSIDSISNIDTLEENGDLTPVSVNAQQGATAIAAINFFKPARSRLDSLWFVELPLSETIPISDYYGVPGQEPPIPITDSFSVPLQGIVDIKTTAPLYDTHFYHAGITYGADEPAIVDSGITIGGQPTE